MYQVFWLSTLHYTKVELLQSDQTHPWQVILPSPTPAYTHVGEEDGLRVLTLRAEDKSLDEAIEEVLEFGGVVGAVDDVAVILGVKLGLGAQFTAKVLARVCAGMRG